MCLNFCSSQAYVTKENKVYVCIDLVFQESNSKTKLEVGDVFRIMPMRNHEKWDQEEAEKASRL